jgi:hypothetical protein
MLSTANKDKAAFYLRGAKHPKNLNLQHALQSNTNFFRERKEKLLYGSA